MFQLHDVKELLEQTPRPVLSLYLNVDPALPENQASNPAWHTWAKNAFRDLGSGLDSKNVLLWPDIRDRVEHYLDGYRPEGKGLALFYALDFERVYQLPVALENHITFGRPLVTPLLWVIDEYKPYLVVMVDHEKARFISAYLGSAEQRETAELELDTSDWAHKTMQSASPYASSTAQNNARDEYAQRVESFRKRFYENVAKRAAQLFKDWNARYIVIAGDEQAGHAVQHNMPEKIAQAVIAVKAMPMRYSAGEALQVIQPLTLEYERQREMTLVEQVINTAKASGRASIGDKAVVHALQRRRVELLLMPWPMADKQLEQELPVLAFASGGDIELVHGPAAERLIAEGGLAARLYYAPTAN